jgi:hypothetical protein
MSRFMQIIGSVHVHKAYSLGFHEEAYLDSRLDSRLNSRFNNLQTSLTNVEL